MMTRFHAVLAVVAMTVALGGSGARDAEAQPSYKELRDLLKANLAGADDAQLDRAAAAGLLRQLSPRVVVVTNGAPAAPPAGSLLVRSCVYDSSFGCVRPAWIGTGLADEIEAAVKALAATNKIKGWVLDLRGADGPDYAAAAAAADRLIATEQPLMDFGQGMVKSKAKENPLQAPLVVLVNRRTARAAEVLAAALRKAEAALLLGTNTAGQGFITKDVPWTGGQQLRIATALVKTGDGEPLPAAGVAPDIRVPVNPEDELLWLDDPRKLLGSAPLSVRGPGEAGRAGSGTNRAGHRINEAELVRMMRDGEDYNEDARSGRAIEPAGPVIRDPVLARALDLLKGLALVRRTR
jgi:hypothetical protein